MDNRGRSKSKKENNERKPSRQRSHSMERPISMSDQRIVLLGKNPPDNCRVGNLILGQKMFKSECHPDQVQEERRKFKKVINVPHLLQPNLSEHQIRETVKQCVNMSDQGPHVIVLVLRPEQCSTQVREHVEKVLNYFSRKVYEHTMVLTIQESESVEPTEANDNLKDIIKKCSNRHYQLMKNSSTDEIRKKLEEFVQTNTGCFLVCDKLEGSGDSEKSTEKQVTGGHTEGPLTVALFGNPASVQFTQDNFLLGEKQLCFNTLETSMIVSAKREIAGHSTNVINMTGLHDAELNQDSQCFIDTLVRKNEIQAFIFVVRLGQMTDSDKTGLEWLQRVFGDKVLQFVIVLFTYETEEESDTTVDDLKTNPVLEKILEKCGGRYQTCNKMMNNPSEMRDLKKKIEDLYEENKQQRYTGEMFTTRAQFMSDNGKNANIIKNENTTSIKKDKQKSQEVASAEETELEEDKEQKMNEKTKRLFDRLHLKDSDHKLRAADVLQINAHSLQSHESCAEEELVQVFLQKLLMMNYRARYISVKDDQHHKQHKDNESPEDMSDIFKAISISNKGTSQSDRIHPMDVQMAVFHCSDGFLKQMMVSKLSQCQFALPLLVPDLITQQIEFPLWTFRQINKSWKIRHSNSETTSQTQPIYKAQTPMVFFFRFGSVSSSKSELMNRLINEKHNTFFHRNCPGSSRTRVLMDGVVEIAWFFPSGTNDDKFTECVSFCDLHGDAGDHEKQLQILTEMASVNVVLLPRLDKDDRSATLIQELYKDSKPLICLFAEDESAVTEPIKGKFVIGLKHRNQSDVSEEIRRAINECLSRSSSTFRLQDVSTHPDIRVDEEDDENCRRGREAAQKMMSLLKEKLTEIKESFLPHQGKLWHQWSQKNKELHRPRADETETDISKKKQEITKIRQRQHESDISKFMTLFIKEMTSNERNEIYFLKWLGILLDEHMSAEFSAILYKYNDVWSKVLKLKENNEQSEQLTTEQTNLEKISEDFQSAAFGLEHIMREIGQIYESCESVKKNKKDLQVHFSSLPSLAAEMMISGFPLELMDGDAAHVPVVWISAVLDQLNHKLGDKKLFVLSVLGLQSSGKSTMLNAMFGLQFAVSAGRCTRGAFMQLVKVSEEMKTQMDIDYILVVDTEGLNALELAGRSTRDHDNELATFVVGLANLTIINIFGENPAEMQDILQIIVHAILRMKQVRLNPSCVFVHQNVSDVTAGEKNLEGRRRLLEKLDEMTKLAAEEEVCDVEYFSDVIEFDVQKDVKYFAHLWEGNPPLAPPNPNYCENVQKLKDTIMYQASKSEIKLQYLKDRVKDLWEALLNERFIFSFRNSLEISAYRKLEIEYSKWSWSLRSAMLEIENKLHNNIENEAIHEVGESTLQQELKKTSEKVEKTVADFFEKGTDANILIQWKTTFEIKIKDVQQNIVKESKMKLNEILQQRDMKKKIDAQRTQRENTLYEKSKELALKLKNKANSDETLKGEFDCFWNQCINEITDTQTSAKNIDILTDVKRLLSDIYQGHFSADHCDEETIFMVTSFSDYVVYKRSKKRERTDTMKDARTLLKERKSECAQTLYPEDEAQIRSLVKDVDQQTDKMIDSFNIAKMGYNISYIQQLTNYIKTRVTDHQKGPVKYVFKNEFFTDVLFSVCKRASKTITVQHMMFCQSNDPVLYLERKRGEYFSIFQKYCHGATSAAIFGEIICQKLKEPIEQSVYKKTARDLSDEMMKNCESLNGNRSNLEKHILKTLAEEEDFNKYMNYIKNPRDHFKSFIRDEVSRYITDRFSVSVLPKMKENIELLQKKILTAAHESTEHVQRNSGDVRLWLKSFTQRLSDDLIFSEKHLSGVKHEEVEDFKLLEDVTRQELTVVMTGIENRFSIETFPVNLDCKFRPDKLLIDHFCLCCWVQCPFCAAICTNTIEDHSGDHSVSFHRVIGLNGIYYEDTENLSSYICTSAVASSTLYFCPNESMKVLWRDYRTAGDVYAKWRITPDLSELPYWKWFVCRFQKDLETHYKKRFEGQGKIPDEWTTYTKLDAFESLDKYF